MEDPLLRRRDRTPTITVRGDIADNLQPPDVSAALMKQLQPIIDSLPPGYRIDMAGSIEESGKATQAMAPLFPIMIALTLLIIILQVRSMSAMVMVFLTAPLGLIGVVPALLLFNQPFGINALVGLIALSGILMRNTLILIGQIHHKREARPRPVPCGDRSYGTAGKTRTPDGNGRCAGVYSPDPFGVLGDPRLYADWRNVRGHHHDAGLLAGDVCDLVPDPSLRFRSIRYDHRRKRYFFSSRATDQEGRRPSGSPRTGRGIFVMQVIK
ncbi:Swarming motility protein SwrC [Raoultella ornithinolytica]|nr:Swarming motility protein SwrC [Raoultella ornithinolytica]